MRFIGAILVFSGCTGLGVWYREQLLGRIRALRGMATILEMLIGEIRYGKSTLPECCRELTMRVGEPFKTALGQVYEACSKNVRASFPEIFVKQMEEILLSLPLKKEDREIFLAPFCGQGFRDGQMQIKCIEQSLLQLREVIRIESEQQREKCRMALGLGVMSGLLLIIIMV